MLCDIKPKILAIIINAQAIDEVEKSGVRRNLGNLSESLGVVVAGIIAGVGCRDKPLFDGASRDLASRKLMNLLDEVAYLLWVKIGKFCVSLLLKKFDISSWVGCSGLWQTSRIFLTSEM